MNSCSSEPIIVALDHTPAGSAALQWAADEAIRLGARLKVVHVFDPSAEAHLAASRNLDDERTRQRIATQRHLVDVLGENAPRLGVTLAQIEGRVADKLTEASEHAVMIVLGTPSTDANTGLPESLHGSCRCPVMVVGEDGVAQPAAALLDTGAADA